MAPYRVARTGPLPCLIAASAERGPAPRPVLVFLHGYDEGPPTDIEEALTRRP